MTFADTSFWYALGDRDDRRHREARSLAASARRSQILTSNHVVGETWTLVRRRMGHQIALLVLELISRLPNVQVAHLREPIERDAWEWLRRHDERQYSFVDATSFALMRARGIREALAFDGDFTAAGFVEVRPSR
jgi:predicted nucleic acid-binding protein